MRVMVCDHCIHKGPIDEFYSEDGDQGFVCPQCGQDESAIRLVYDDGERSDEISRSLKRQLRK